MQGSIKDQTLDKSSKSNPLPNLENDFHPYHIPLHNHWWLENRKTSVPKGEFQTISLPALRCLQMHHQAAEGQSVKPCVLYHCLTWNYPFGVHWEDQKWPYIWSPCPWRQSVWQAIWKVKKHTKLNLQQSDIGENDLRLFLHLLSLSLPASKASTQHL